jgi:hypothetical protein
MGWEPPRVSESLITGPEGATHELSYCDWMITLSTAFICMQCCAPKPKLPRHSARLYWRAEMDTLQIILTVYDQAPILILLTALLRTFLDQIAVPQQPTSFCSKKSHSSQEASHPQKGCAMAEGRVLVQTCDDPEEQRKLQKPAPQLYHYCALQERGWFRLLSVEPSPTHSIEFPAASFIDPSTKAETLKRCRIPGALMTR